MHAHILHVKGRDAAGSLSQYLEACIDTANVLPRLKVPLNLPPIEPRPPIPPRVYKRLYNHLDNILPGKVRIATPSAARVRDSFVVGSSPAIGSDIRSKTTPGLDRSVGRKAVADFGNEPTYVDTPSKATRQGLIRAFQHNVGLPPWVKPTLGALIAQNNQQGWGRYALAGANYIIAPGDRRTKDEWVLNNMTAVVAALFYVTVKVVDAVGNEPEAGKVVCVQGQRKVVDFLQRVRRRILPAKGLSPEEYWERWADPDLRSFQRAVKLVESKFIDADWYRALEDGAFEKFDPENLAVNERGVLQKVKVQKPDTMHQERYNYTSASKRAEAAAFKRDVMRRIADMEKKKQQPQPEQQGGDDLMDMDGGSMA